jgi:hypothetical protein
MARKTSAEKKAEARHDAAVGAVMTFLIETGQADGNTTDYPSALSIAEALCTPADPSVPDEDPLEEHIWFVREYWKQREDQEPPPDDPNRELLENDPADFLVRLRPLRDLLQRLIK